LFEDQTWVTHYTPDFWDKNKFFTVGTQHTPTTSLPKIKNLIFGEKCMVTVFWDGKEII